MPERHFFWLYRPTLPSVRAQSIQILHSAHAMAMRGHQVELVAEAAPSFDRKGGQAEVLSYYGLEPCSNLVLTLLRGSRTKRSLLYRAFAASFAARHGRKAVFVSRSKRQAVEARRWFGKRVTIVLETHELDSALARERGESSASWLGIEESAAHAADAMVANCPGTLELWKEHHTIPPAVALQNATRADRIRKPNPSAEGVGYVGSARSYKDLDTIIALSNRSSRKISWIGSDPPSEVRCSPICVKEAVSHREVPDLLCSFRVLLLPLSDCVFGQRLSSPLKLWDYMAAGVPIVGADVRSLHEAATEAFFPYRPGDVSSLHRAVETVYTDERIRRRLLSAAFVRTWEQRAIEFSTFLDEVL